MQNYLKISLLLLLTGGLSQVKAMQKYQKEQDKIERYKQLLIPDLQESVSRFTDAVDTVLKKHNPVTLKNLLETSSESENYELIKEYIQSLYNINFGSIERNIARIHRNIEIYKGAFSIVQLLNEAMLPIDNILKLLNMFSENKKTVNFEFYISTYVGQVRVNIAQVKTKWQRIKDDVEQLINKLSPEQTLSEKEAKKEPAEETD